MATKFFSIYRLEDYSIKYYLSNNEHMIHVTISLFSLQNSMNSTKYTQVELLKLCSQWKKLTGEDYVPIKVGHGIRDWDLQQKMDKEDDLKEHTIWVFDK